jgi:hypothetical protein
MATFDWSRLNHLQVGRYAEYLVKMEMVRAGLDVFTAEVDDKGIDFVVRRDALTYYDIQVKSLRGQGYVFLQKQCFSLRPNLWAALVLFPEGAEAALFLVPATAWTEPNALLVDRDYGEGLKSKPEYGINISAKNMALLREYAFERMVERLQGPQEGRSA